MYRMMDEQRVTIQPSGVGFSESCHLYRFASDFVAQICDNIQPSKCAAVKVMNVKTNPGLLDLFFSN